MSYTRPRTTIHPSLSVRCLSTSLARTRLHPRRSSSVGSRFSVSATSASVPTRPARAFASIPPSRARPRRRPLSPRPVVRSDPIRFDPIRSVDVRVVSNSIFCASTMKCETSRNVASLWTVGLFFPVVSPVGVDDGRPVGRARPSTRRRDRRFDCVLKRRRDDARWRRRSTAGPSANGTISDLDFRRRARRHGRRRGVGGRDTPTRRSDGGVTRETTGGSSPTRGFAWCVD